MLATFAPARLGRFRFDNRRFSGAIDAEAAPEAEAPVPPPVDCPRGAGAVR